MKELNYTTALEASKASFVINGMEYMLMPGLIEMFHLCKEDLAKEILASSEDKNRYQLVLTIKDLS